MNCVIRIYKRYEFAISQIYTAISRNRQPTVAAMQHTDAAVARSIFIADGRRAVGAAVVHDNYIQVAEGLPDNAVKTLAEILSGIVHRDYD